jgi:putative salt-induced outer membrane protein YdiY
MSGRNSLKFVWSTKAVALFLLLQLIFGVAIAEQQSSGFIPPPDEYDWIQLTSDEWLKGELLSLFDDELRFDSDNFDVLNIDWEDVRFFRSHGAYGISIQGKGSMAGELVIDEHDVVIMVDGERREFRRDQLVAITPVAERELDRWSGDLSLGLNVRSGNADIVEFNTLIGIERRTPRSRFLMDYLGNFNETEGQEIANNHRVNASFDRFSGGRLFWRPFIGQYYRDTFQNIQGQGTVETGLGYELVDTPRTEWEISGGLGFSFVNFDSVEAGQESDNKSPVFSISTDLDYELTSWMDYLLQIQVSFLNEDSGAYQHHLLTTLSTDLIGDLDLDVSFVWDRTQKPEPRADGTVPEKDDYRLMVGLAYEF